MFGTRTVKCSRCGERFNEDEQGAQDDHEQTHDEEVTWPYASIYVTNPVTGKHENLDELPEDGYKRQFLQLFSIVQDDNTINLRTAPVLTFDDDRWKLRRTDTGYALIKHESESRLDELVLNEGHSADR